MIDKTATTRCNCTVQIPPMETSVSHGTVRRSTFSDVTTSGTGKRRRLDQQDEYNHFQLQYRYQRDVDMNLLENVASISATSDHANSSFMCCVNDDLISDLKAEYVTEIELHHDVDVNLLENVASVSATSDHANSSFMCSVNEDLISDLKAECVSVTETFISVTDGFSRNISELSVICLETEEIESESTSKPNNNNNKKKKKTTRATATVTVVVAENEATSRRKPPPPAATMPCATEIEEFFSKAEKYEQKRFAEKYNYDIVKDVPMEGRYQWIELKP